MRARINRLSNFFLVILAVISLAFGYWQVVRADELVARQDNPRWVETFLRTPRGRILDRNGQVLAYSERTDDGYYRRVYTEPSLSPVIGFTSHQFGETGIEAAMSTMLTGAGPAEPITALARLISNANGEGNDVVLTIDLELQRAAVQAMGDKTGAIVVVDPRNGEVLAMVSRPHFDASQLAFDPGAESWSAELQRIDAYWQEARAAPGSPLLNHATQGLYAPGSTYKTITAATALERGVANPSTVYPVRLNAPDRDHNIWWHHDNHVDCTNHPENHRELTLTGAYAWSCNVIFAGLALQTGADAFVDMSRRFGVGERPPIEIAAEISRVYVDADFLTGENREAALASTGMGQGELAMTPLQMALIAAAPAADGVIYAPHLVKEVRAPDGSVIDRTEPQVWKRAVSPQTAAQLRAMMAESARSGWANAAAVPGIQVAGKTGTAEHGLADERPHSWFIGFAPADQATTAIAVVEAFTGGGSAYAAPAARAVIQQAVGQ